MRNIGIDISKEKILEETTYDNTLADAKEFAGKMKREYGRLNVSIRQASHIIRSRMDVRILREECTGSQPPTNHTCPQSASVSYKITFLVLKRRQIILDTFTLQEKETGITATRWNV